MSRILVVWRKSCRMCGLRDFARNDLLQGIDALAIGIEGVHKMHFCDVCGEDGDMFDNRSARWLLRVRLKS